jgi:ribosomal protein S18 acetylase RimI-like enzyme
MRTVRRNERDYLRYRVGHGGTVEIDDIAVYSERQRGTGRSMFDEMMANSGKRRAFAFARAENAVARRFYAALGFSAHEVPGFYEDGDAVLFTYGKAD